MTNLRRGKLLPSGLRLIIIAIGRTSGTHATNGGLWFHSLLIKYQVDVVPGERQRFVPVILNALKSVFDDDMVTKL